MTTTHTTPTSVKSAYPNPEWELFVGDPEPIEDGMQQEPHITALISVLRHHFGDRPDVFTSAGGFLCYNRSNRNDRIAPDLYIALEVDVDRIWTMPNYLVWEVGKPPDFVLEVASGSTAANDLGGKRNLYSELGIQECWRLDAESGKHYGEELVGERLIAGEYQRYELHTEQDGSIWSHSEVLGLDFCRRTDGRFWVRNSATGQWLNFLDAEREAHIAIQTAWHQEIEARLLEREVRREAEIRANREAEARQVEREARRAAEAQVQALQAEIERLRRQQDE